MSVRNWWSIWTVAFTLIGVIIVLSRVFDISLIGKFACFYFERRNRIATLTLN